MPAEIILSIWDRLFPHEGALPPELARYALRLGLSDEDRARMTALAEKNGDGTLAPDERAELEAYSHAAAFLSVLQSKARVALRSPAAVNGNGAPTA
jgi:hypothetical protein